MMKPTLSKKELQTFSVRARSAILTMTTLAGSGHPGGSMSSIDLLLALYHCDGIDLSICEMRNAKCEITQRDKVIVSHGHISPAVYTTLAMRGYFDLEEAIVGYRLIGSRFEGHIEPDVPGVEWATGNLGQGLSAATGFSIESKIRGWKNHIYCLMGDGEQQKGQIGEARRFAVKYKLHNITAIIDYNRLQISGNISDVMPQDIKANYQSDGWEVIEIDGHNFEQIYEALSKAREIDAPVLILAHTVMGKGVSFMENKEKYHGSTLPESDLSKAYDELGVSFDIETLKQKRSSMRKELLEKIDTEIDENIAHHYITEPQTPKTEYRLYNAPTDNRSAFGDAMVDVGANSPHIAVFDCDLSGSVKTGDFAKKFPDQFFQSGIMEHHTAVCAGALSKTGIQTFWADFGIFGIDEVYNQLRLNDINDTNLKVILTHTGLDVGEDGKTHQCIDYIGLVRNLYHFHLIIPADPNQTYKVIRYLAGQYGNFLVPMGRSKLAPITKENGDIYYDKDYEFVYGKADILRTGKKATVFVTGTLVGTALKVVDNLNARGHSIRLVNISTPFAIDPQIVSDAVDTGLIFTIEDHNVHTGLGNIIAQMMVDLEKVCTLKRLGVEDYAYSGTADDVYTAMGLSEENIEFQLLCSLETKAISAGGVVYDYLNPDNRFDQ